MDVWLWIGVASLATALVIDLFRDLRLPYRIAAWTVGVFIGVLCLYMRLAEPMTGGTVLFALVVSLVAGFFSVLPSWLLGVIGRRSR